MATTLTLNVSASSDDARNVSGNGTFNSTVVTQHLGILSSTDYWNGFRWLNVTVPQGATITSATIDLFSAGVSAGTTVELIFYGVDEDDAATFANNTDNKPEGKARTTASVTKTITVANWSSTGFQSGSNIDVKDLVQEIVNRPGWTSGNALAIVGHDNGSTGTNSYVGHSTYDRAADRGAKLSIEYEDTPPATDIAFDAASEATANSYNTSLSWSHTCTGTDTNGLLVVSVMELGDGIAPSTVTGITYNSVAMTKVDTAIEGTVQSELWYLKAPATGSHTIDITFNGTNNGWQHAVAGSYTGVDQTTPVEAHNTNISGTTSVSASVTTLTDGAWVVDSFGKYDTAGTPSVGGSQTLRKSSSGGSSGWGVWVGQSSQAQPTAGSTTNSWSWSGAKDAALVVAALKPDSGTPPTPTNTSAGFFMAAGGF